MMPAVPQPTPAPIHDIADDMIAHLLGSGALSLWLVATLAFLALVALIFWLTRRKRPMAVLTPRQRALAALEALRRQGPEADSYGFGVEISDTLRTYIRDQHGLDAVTRTSVEFLEELRDNPAFTENEKAGLAEFLESVDLLKYARLPAAPDDIESLLTIAERLVRGESTLQTGVAK
jgi:Domain of unknown function (DUF4381)